MTGEARLEPRGLHGEGRGDHPAEREEQGEGVDEAVELPLLPPIGEGQKRGQSN